MKNKKLKLEDLKVQSFVTSMGSKEKRTIDGGIWHFVVATVEGTFPSKIGSGGACSEGCAPEPEIENPWCTLDGAEYCGFICW